MFWEVHTAVGLTQFNGKYFCESLAEWNEICLWLGFAADSRIGERTVARCRVGSMDNFYGERLKQRELTDANRTRRGTRRFYATRTVEVEHKDVTVSGSE